MKTDNASKVPNVGSGYVATVLLQDYFHHRVFKGIIGERHWGRFESRLDSNIEQACDLLEEYHATATFFAFGWIAERYPSIVARVVERGHEVADAGYVARDVSEMSRDQFVQEVSRSRKVIEDATGQKVLGFRSYKSIRSSDLWILDELAKLGYQYDVSLQPNLFELFRRSARYPFVHVKDGKRLVELPMPTQRILAINLPIAGGNFIRQLPQWLMYPAFQHWNRRGKGPFVLYFHPWELDPEQPRISAIGALSQIRHYRNLGKFREVLPYYFSVGAFRSVRDYLGIEASPTARSSDRSADLENRSSAEMSGRRFDAHGTPVTVVIPCYNEESTLPYLEKSLAELEDAAVGTVSFSFVLVDDCSKDATRSELQRIFDDKPNCTLVFHEANKGVAGAIRTGIEHAKTDIVCSIDADCSYDPLELLRMIPELDDETDMVTASPYHPNGFVVAVPQWRLFLSRGLSAIYRLILRNKLATYTSCFRVARRDAVLREQQEYGDFRGIVEMLARMDLHGARIKEFPTTLQSRVFGYSKMKTIKTIWGHLGLLGRLLVYRKDRK